VMSAHAVAARLRRCHHRLVGHHDLRQEIRAGHVPRLSAQHSLEKRALRALFLWVISTVAGAWKSIADSGRNVTIYGREGTLGRALRRKFPGVGRKTGLAWGLRISLGPAGQPVRSASPNPQGD
jgi:hypothetical protein